MRRGFLSFSFNILRLPLLAGLSALVLPMASAQALDYAGEAHCFARNSDSRPLDPEDRYANGSMQDEEQVAAVEELTRRQWKLRLTGLPFMRNIGTYTQQFDDGINGRQLRYDLYDAFASIELEEARERRNRRTGSRHIYVTPEMKMLARNRGEVRSYKQKPCNKHILYLGG